VSGDSAYRKRPVTVEAVRWTGDNLSELYEFTGRSHFDQLDEQDRANSADPEATASVFDKLHSTWVLVYTGQWVIKGIRGEFYPCADDVFRETYEPAEDGVSGNITIGGEDLGSDPWEAITALHAQRASLTGRVAELRARLDTLTDRAEAGGVITGDEADEYRKEARPGGGVEPPRDPEAYRAYAETLFAPVYGETRRLQTLGDSLDGPA
jgi:hypothetical protein